MHTDNKNIMLVDYCRLDEIPACKLKLKAELFSTFCKIAKESERYIFTFWYTEAPLSKRGNSVQLAINAVIKDRHTDTEDVFKKIIPYTGRTLFSFFSSIFKLNKNHNEFLGEKKMIVKCPKCGTIIPCSTSNETALLKEEIKNKDLIIEQLRKENEEYETIIKNITAEKAEEKPEVPSTEENTEEKVNEVVEEVPAETETTEEVVNEAAETAAEEAHEEIKEETPTTEAPTEETIVESVEEPKVEEVKENEPSIEPAEEKIEVEVEQPSEVVEENKEENITPMEETSPMVEENIEANEEEKVEDIPCDSISQVEEKPEMVGEQPQEEVKEEAPKADEDPYHIHTPVIVKI